ncbi:hypothetical protein AVDCRST_MAG81-3717 [uncultured Synechococcales cyanobacterium]|uniref:Uncharacterized protein n=1 Tax=uncultured Synechococcales cyanobacterium TaxID=1936017 RepID=A0A6J4VRA6_9CYAN|nr:hypothetical protein AVDCRST_MAG81-3717 [uncultured Synechococcales cyanobacterium]
MLLPIAQAWYETNVPETLPRLARLRLLSPFLGTTSGAWLLLAAILMVFGLPIFLPYAISMTLTSLIGWLVWQQIGRSLGRRLVRSYMSEFSQQRRT